MLLGLGPSWLVQIPYGIRLCHCYFVCIKDYNDMMMDGNVTPEYIDEPAYVDNSRYINVPPDMLEQNSGKSQVWRGLSHV